MPAIKLILIGLVLGLLLWAFRNRKHVGMRAGARLLAIFLGVLAVVSVADPDITTSVARRVGVGRGADLLLYLLVVAFGFTSAGLYFRSRDLERKLDLIIRKTAIREALLEDGAPAAAGCAGTGGTPPGHAPLNVVRLAAPSGEPLDAL